MSFLDPILLILFVVFNVQLLRTPSLPFLKKIEDKFFIASSYLKSIGWIPYLFIALVPFIFWNAYGNVSEDSFRKTAHFLRLFWFVSVFVSICFATVSILKQRKLKGFVEGITRIVLFFVVSFASIIFLYIIQDPAGDDIIDCIKRGYCRQSVPPISGFIEVNPENCDTLDGTWIEKAKVCQVSDNAHGCTQKQMLYWDKDKQECTNYLPEKLRKKEIEFNRPYLKPVL